jgi:hypothetical protein
MYKSLTSNLPPELKPKDFDNEYGFAIVRTYISGITASNICRLSPRVRQLWTDSRGSPSAFDITCFRNTVVQLAMGSSASHHVSVSLHEARQQLCTKKVWKNWTGPALPWLTNDTAKRQEISGITVPIQIAEYLEAEMYSAKQQTILAKRSPETCLTLTQSTNFCNWRDGSRPSTLICQGEPGTGKSVFASVVIDSLQKHVRNKQQDALAYIYIDYAKLEQNTEVGSLLRSILKQLLRAIPFVPEPVSLLYSEVKREGKQPNAMEAETAILQVITTFPGRTFIVLDALDECKDTVSTELLEVLSRVQRNANLSILATSRTDDNIATEFRGTLVSYLPISGAKHDIERFLRSNISRTSSFLRRSASRRTQDTIVQIISESSEGM